MTDEEWVDWNAANDNDWYEAVENTFGFIAKQKNTLKEIITMETATPTPVDPSKIMQVGTGFWLLNYYTAVNMELFTILAKENYPERKFNQADLHQEVSMIFLMP